RQNVQPWMLFNLCLALRYLGRYAEATSLAKYVLEKWGHRERSADMRLFLAIEDALAGAIPEAAEHLQRVVVRKNVPYDQELVALTRALVEFQQSPENERVERFKSVRKDLEKRFSAWRLLHVMKDVRRTFRRAGKVFVEKGGGWRAKWWFHW